MKIFTIFWDLKNFDRFVPQFKALKKSKDSLLIAFYRGLIKKEWTHDFDFIPLKITDFSKLPFLRRFYSITIEFLYNQPMVVREILNSSLEYDIIYSLSGINQITSSILSKKTGIPYVLRLRGFHLDVKKKYFNFYLKFLGSYLNYQEKKSLKRADLVIPISRELKNYAVKMRAKVSKIIYNGIDVNLFRPTSKLNPRDFTIGFIGRTTPEKGFFTFLNIAKKMPHLKFIAVGPITSTNFKIPKNMKLIDKVSFLRMPEIYNMLDIVCLPSISEGFPNIILESLSTCTPIIATKVGEIPYIVNDAFGILYDINKNLESNLVNILNYYAENRKELKCMGQKGRNYVVDNFSWAKYGENMNEILGSIMKT